MWALIIAYSVTFSVLSIARHYGFYSLEDSGAFPQMFWATLHGKFFHTDLPGLGRFAFTPHNYLGEHFSPILFLLIPVYAAWQGPEVLFVVQSIMLGLAALPLYALVHERFGDRYLAISFAIAWLISPYVWQSNIADFHPDTFEPLFIFSAFYYLFQKRTLPYLAFILLSLLCKEDTFVYVIAIGFFAIVAQRAIPTGVYTIALGALWGISTFKLFMPVFGGGMSYVDHYSHLGGTVPAILQTSLFEPQRIIAHLGQPAIRRTIFWILMTVGFLPLLSPVGFMLAIPSALERLLTRMSHINTLSWYYSMAVLPLLFIAALAATSNILRLVTSDGGRRTWSRGIGGLLIIAGLISGIQLGFGIVGGFALTMPPPTISKDGWIWVTRRDSEIRRLLAGVPESASVSTSPYIAAHVARRFELRVYPYRPLDRDVILLDLYGQKYPADLATYKCEIVEILSRGEYGVVEYLDGFLYLRRGHATTRNATVAGQVASIFEAEDMYADGVEKVFDLGAGNKLAMSLAKRGSAGVIHGPYVSLPPGRYEVAFRMKARERTPEDVARIDVSANRGETILTERTIRGRDFREAGRYEEFTLTVRSEETIENVEFRAYLQGGKQLWIDRINLYPGSLALTVVRDSCPR